jgi:hypothetical protein
VPLQQRERVVDALRADVVERGGDLHAASRDGGRRAPPG